LNSPYATTPSPSLSRRGGRERNADLLPSIKERSKDKLTLLLSPLLTKEGLGVVKEL
jgi:hypothetical protein